MASHTYLIIGGGPAAGHAIKEFLDRDLAHGEVALISADNHVPYDRPPLSKALLQGKKKPEDTYIVQPAALHHSGVQTYLGTTAQRIDVANRWVETSSGDRIQFDKLLLATGSRVERLTVGGADEAAVMYLRSLDDAQAIRTRWESANHAVVIGGGYIGTEVAASLAMGGGEVTLVYPQAHLLHRLFTPEMSDFYEGYFRQHRVELVPNDEVARFLVEKEHAKVVLKSGEVVSADMVVAGVGVTPALELFEGTPLDVEEGVVVDGYLQTSVDGIYAAGDAAYYPDPIFNKRRRVEHWQNAVDQGRLAARNMLGEHEEYAQAPYFFSDVFDLSWEYWGDQEEADEALHVGDFETGSFSVWWTARDIVQAVFVLNRSDEERELAKACVEQQKEIPGAIKRAGDTLELKAERRKWAK